MIDNIVIFEDLSYKNFYPLTLTRPVFELRCGIKSLVEKIVHLFPQAHFSLFSRNFLKAQLSYKYPNVPVNVLNTGGAVLLVNGRLIAGAESYPFFPDGEDRDFVLVKGKDIVFAYLRNENLNIIKPYITEEFRSLEIMKVLQKKVSFREIQATLVEYPWDFIRLNQQQITNDFISLKQSGVIKGCVHSRAVLYDEENMFIGKNTEVMAECVLDARKGPIYIGENVLIKSGSYIEGPSYIGDNAIVSKGYLREGSNIGKYCRVGGEIEETIFYEYSNKYHEGFVGHSYIGAWVNLGALTTTSDLKNNYSTVKITHDNNVIDTGLQFMGSVIGDYTKFGIGSLLSTGSVFGIGCNLFGGGIFPRFVPDFIWGDNKNFEPHDIKKFITTTDIVMKRRNISLSVQQEDALISVYNLTAESRNAFLAVR
ncbi:MAG: hypothetical protein A2X42_02830 [Candidatus Margulisbacteria bacterium GWF2_38_17]|nr:MAG: hypothetical protein A2X43_04320 [Candidatus Margulisbacteria bacterium GWD2_39_127]OGI05223.1 MAG: hypothetical protein A2X42_02830 [Candidatus Margulisbacteria bacterium GWF2_38_17]OGI06272.1 MAG: hypothetical protein A2X41_08410 [Candidatus Margulisbacteria bacterium GWE2_39_32]